MNVVQVHTLQELDQKSDVFVCDFEKDRELWSEVVLHRFYIRISASPVNVEKVFSLMLWYLFHTFS